MNITANGTIPPRNKLGIGFTYHGCTGICRGIWVVFVGCSYAGFFCPNQAPRRTRGTDIRSHIETNATKVENGIALDDACAQTKRFSTSTAKKISPGTSRAVWGCELANASFSSPATFTTHQDSVFGPTVPPKCLVDPAWKISREQPSKYEKEKPKANEASSITRIKQAN